MFTTFILTVNSLDFSCDGSEASATGEGTSLNAQDEVEICGTGGSLTDWLVYAAWHCGL